MIFNLPHQAKQAIKAIEIAKDGYYCKIAKKKSKRSLNQNRYYWGVVVEIFSQESGYEPKEVHQILCKHFLSYEKKDKTFVKSTTDLSTKEFEDYMTKCRMLGSKQGYYIPEPNECDNYIYESIQQNKLYK